MEQVLALQVHVRAHALREPPGVVERRRPADVGSQQTVQLGAEAGILARFEPRLLERRERRHQRLGHVAAAIAAETLFEPVGGLQKLFHQTGAAARSTESKKRFSFSGSLRPGSASTPLATSTANGLATSIASATLSWSSPPDSTSGGSRGCSAASFQSNR